MSVKTICVFCGARPGASPVYKDLAKSFGEKMAQLGLTLVYGGSGSGLMGALSEGVFDNGGKVVGIYPKVLNQYDPLSAYLSEIVLVDTISIRKEKMIECSDAFVILPGGIGTLDEVFEVISLSILKAHNKPIIIVNYEGFWDKLKDLIIHVVDKQMAAPGIFDLFHYVDNIDDVFKKLGVVE